MGNSIENIIPVMYTMAKFPVVEIQFPLIVGLLILLSHQHQRLNHRFHFLVEERGRMK